MEFRMTNWAHRRSTSMTASNAERVSRGGLDLEPLEFRHSTFWIRHSRRAGFAGAREVAEEGEEAALVGVGEGFEVVEDEKGAGAGEGIDKEARALVGGGLGDLGLLEPSSDGIQHLRKPADSEGAFVVRAMRVHGGLLGGEE